MAGIEPADSSSTMGEADASADPERTTARTRGAGTSAGELLPDFQSLLAGTLRSLAEATRSTRVGAWARRPSGEPYVVAAAFRDAPSPEPPDTASLEALEAVWDAGRPVDLGADGPGTPLSVIGVRHGFSAAAPLISTDHERIAMLLLGGPMDPAGAVRPRTLAALEGAIARLRSPAMAAVARARLSRLDEDVCRLDRLASLGDLLAEVAHEIRNPLVSLKTFMQLLPDHLDDPEFHEDFRKVVTEELHRMERLLNTLLGHARPASESARTRDSGDSANLVETFESMQRLLQQRATERGVKLESNLDDALPAPAISEDALRQILLNLILNALDAAPPRTSIVLWAEQVEPTLLEFSIEDSGPGVPLRLRPRLFEPFFSTRSGAGGLGLAISKKLAEDVGGSIRVEDSELGGARFCVGLPIADPAGPPLRER